MKKKVLILHTGGTIGMVRGLYGYVPEAGSFLPFLNTLPEMHHESLPEWDFQETDPLLDSSDIAVPEWNKIAAVIRDRYPEYDGFVVLHGTDTMAYTASALSFQLGGLAKPVILTGSQIPMRELRSDGLDNIIQSLVIAADGIVSEVCICFNGRLMRGNRCKKRSSEQFGAFETPNEHILAEAGVAIRYNRSLLRKAEAGSFRCTLLEEIPVGILKVYPGIRFSDYREFFSGNMKGVVIETFGAGNIPSRDRELGGILKKAAGMGTVITVCSQCPQGSVALGAYETSNALQNAAAADGRDMTTEAALAKMIYLFSMHLPPEQVRIEISRNLRGEITES